MPTRRDETLDALLRKKERNDHLTHLCSAGESFNFTLQILTMFAAGLQVYTIILARGYNASAQEKGSETFRYLSLAALVFLPIYQCLSVLFLRDIFVEFNKIKFHNWLETNPFNADEVEKTLDDDRDQTHEKITQNDFVDNGNRPLLYTGTLWLGYQAGGVPGIIGAGLTNVAIEATEGYLKAKL